MHVTRESPSPSCRFICTARNMHAVDMPLPISITRRGRRARMKQCSTCDSIGP